MPTASQTDLVRYPVRRHNLMSLRMLIISHALCRAGAQTPLGVGPGPAEPLIRFRTPLSALGNYNLTYLCACAALFWELSSLHELQPQGSGWARVLTPSQTSTHLQCGNLPGLPFSEIAGIGTCFYGSNPPGSSLAFHFQLRTWIPGLNSHGFEFGSAREHTSWYYVFGSL